MGDTSGGDLFHGGDWGVMVLGVSRREDKAPLLWRGLMVPSYFYFNGCFFCVGSNPSDRTCPNGQGWGA